MVAIACKGLSYMGTANGLERVLGVLATAKIVSPQVWDKRLYKHKIASGEV